MSSNARNAGSRLVRGRVSTLPTGSPHYAVGGSRVERSCPWTRTVQGFAGRVGRPDCGQWCLGEEGSGRHCAGLRSPCAERRWLQERKLVVVGKSRAAPPAIFPTASSVVQWKVQNWRVGHPLIGLDS